MKISEKINMTKEQLEENGPITIVAFGDSVTHGCLSAGVIDYEIAYWNLLKKKINAVRNYVPVNVINAGIGSTTATTSLKRLESQVLKHEPDLVIVCFGLNDVNGELDDYLSAMKIIFEKCMASGAEVIFLTPNMLNTYVADDTFEGHRKYAYETAEMQNSGKMDRYINAAVELAQSMNVTVCDCYAMWKKLAETEDTTMMLSNRVNHPALSGHMMFADCIFNAIFKDGKEAVDLGDLSMYKSEK